MKNGWENSKPNLLKQIDDDKKAILIISRMQKQMKKTIKIMLYLSISVN